MPRPQPGPAPPPLQDPRPSTDPAVLPAHPERSRAGPRLVGPRSPAPLRVALPSLQAQALPTRGHSPWRHAGSPTPSDSRRPVRRRRPVRGIPHSPPEAAPQEARPCQPPGPGGPGAVPCLPVWRYGIPRLPRGPLPVPLLPAETPQADPCFPPRRHSLPARPCPRLPGCPLPGPLRLPGILPRSTAPRVEPQAPWIRSPSPGRPSVRPYPQPRCCRPRATP